MESIDGNAGSRRKVSTGSAPIGESTKQTDLPDVDSNNTISSLLSLSNQSSSSSSSSSQSLSTSSSNIVPFHATDDSAATQTQSAHDMIETLKTHIELHQTIASEYLSWCSQQKKEIEHLWALVRMKDEIIRGLLKEGCEGKGLTLEQRRHMYGSQISLEQEKFRSGERGE